MAVMKKIKTTFLLLTLTLSSVPLVYAADPLAASSSGNDFLTRGQAVHQVVETFDLRKKNENFVTDCLLHLDECFFVFTAMTRYDQVSLYPMRLYPDVTDAYAYTDDIHLATMLGLVHGNIDEKNSPFYPRAYMTRIHALKVILGAAELMDWREKFEMVRDLGNEDALRDQKSIFADVTGYPDDFWWYPRYVNFALDKGIIDAGEYFRPDEPITADEYQDMLQRALKESVLFHDQQAQSRRNSSQQTAG